MTKNIELSIIMPCLNEAETVGVCIDKAKHFLSESKVIGEVIVADNGSTDGSQQIASKAGALVISIPEKGYGNALMSGIKAASGKYIIMGDADDSYDFTALGLFLEKLRLGYDLVMGNRFEGGITRGAMPWHHRYIGNPALSGIGKLFFNSSANDFHSGLRGFSKEAFERMYLQTTGMEFASEMVIKATLSGMKITEIPVTLYPDGRSRPPHLRSFRDGWRHLRFMLLYSPRWLFFYPGIFFVIVGGILMLWLLPGPQRIGDIFFDIHTMLYAVAFIILGLQSILFATFTKTFAISEGLLPEDVRINKFSALFSLEKGLLFGVGLTILGVLGSLDAIFLWEKTSFGSLDPARIMRITIPSILTVILGVQLIFSSFFLSILRLKRKHPL
jgi:glycosyltransferase involved in cell wall biosynthesis